MFESGEPAKKPAVGNYWEAMKHYNLTIMGSYGGFQSMGVPQ